METIQATMNMVQEKVSNEQKQALTIKTTPIQVSSEIGQLYKLLVHSPDGGIGKVIPTKAQDWLYEDIVDLRQMQKEYDVYKQILLAFLDPEVLKKWFEREINDEQQATSNLRHKRPNYVKPGHPEFVDSDRVVEFESVLKKILENTRVRSQLVSTICAIERCGFEMQHILLNDHSCYEPFSAGALAKILITGYVDLIPNEKGRQKQKKQKRKQIFPPIPNLIFTRDIGVVVNDHLILSKLAKRARLREAVLAQYMAYYDFFKGDFEKVIEVTEDSDYFLCNEEDRKFKAITLEGGDMMMVHPTHLVIGCSERTSPNAISKLVNQLFQQELLRKVTVVVIPKQRGTMHIDTVFTQVKRNIWVLYGPLSGRSPHKLAEKVSYVHDFTDRVAQADSEIADVRIVQFVNSQDPDGAYRRRYDLECLEDLFEQISREDFRCKEPVQILYAGGDEYPYNEREQWTDACNVVALREGVVIGYDRNHKTTEVFQQNGFSIKRATDLIKQLKAAYKNDSEVDFSKIIEQEAGKDTLILIPSGELSRARGGSHCMSMPLWRAEVSE